MSDEMPVEDTPLLAAVLKRFLNGEVWADLDGPSICLDGWVSVSPEELDALRRAQEET